MKKVLFLLCWIGIAVMISGCDDGDDGGSAGGYGEFPEVSFAINESTGKVICYNADKNVITTNQICTWNCAHYNDYDAPRKVILWFDEALVPTDGQVDPVTGDITYTYGYEMALVKEQFGTCVL